EQGEEEPGEPEPPWDGAWGGCWWMPHVPLTLSPQRLCARCYHGHLASIHNYATNQRLRCTARARTNRGQVWIGGYTSRVGPHRCLRSHWIDHSLWNYSNWASGNPSHASQMCVALCTTGGRWRSVNCQARLPFICAY
uniref:C-type lectin domain-containing protein n=1 Tax=Gopherus evgoodei TaxID=1825980 RepID=A0A8C4W6B1_9SAUR